MMSKLDVRLNPQQMNSGLHKRPSHQDGFGTRIVGRWMFARSFSSVTRFPRRPLSNLVTLVGSTLSSPLIRRRPADDLVLAEFQTSDLNEGDDRWVAWDNWSDCSIKTGRIGDESRRVRAY